ncbi:MAG: hypothetical protein AB7G25_04560 [Sphingomonadaceae bacterium]
MSFAKRAGGLAKLDTGRGKVMVENLKAFNGDAYDTAFEDIAYPPRRVLATFTDEELAELQAREPHSREGHLAASIMRSRESWRTPGRWSLIVAGMSLVVAISALVRTL